MMEEVRRAATVIGGTPYYMAPEQGAGESVDHRADLYAFGVTLFELVTGRLPFTDGDVTYHHRHTPAPDPREFAPEVPEALADLIAHMMAKRPDERIDSAEEVRRRLEAIAAVRAGSRAAGKPAG
jgi:serine/threonine-protein kinase